MTSLLGVASPSPVAASISAAKRHSQSQCAARNLSIPHRLGSLQRILLVRPDYAPAAAPHNRAGREGPRPHKSQPRIKFRLKLIGIESIAAFELAALITALEPALALGRGAVSEGVRHDIALRLLLDLVVADRARRIQRVVDIAGLDDVFALLGVIGEDAGEAIGLQFDAHLQSIRLGLAHALPHRLHLIHDAEQLLHVMADLVGDDIGLREIALYAEAVLQLLVEVEVNINLLVVGT